MSGSFNARFGLAPQIDSSGEMVPAIEFSKNFFFQSYFDSTLLAAAILTPTAGAPGIIASTQAEQQISGYAIGLHPDSSTPVAVQFKNSDKSGNTGTYFLKPGEVIKPSGGKFNGFVWGLPFGWLGGGLARLVVFTTPDAHVDWGAHLEIIFHRARYTIYQPAGVTSGALPTAPLNWPIQFPWAGALNSAGLSVGSTPIIQISEATRVLLVLRGLTTLATPAEMRVVMQATDDVGLSSAGAPVLTNPIFDTITWPSWASLGTSGNLATQNPALMYSNGILNRVSSQLGGIIFIDNAAAALTGCFVDVVRYGRL